MNKLYKRDKTRSSPSRLAWFFGAALEEELTHT
uniref:Uncharacterized protein n=1 Tax=Rhizophora mucronata TaxID=61149 RepID=A0A2P2N7P6_RHIMU